MLAAALVALVAAAPQPKPSTVGVMPLRVEGTELTAAQRKSVAVTIRDGLSVTAKVASAQKMNKAKPPADGCANRACWRSTAKAAKVDYLADVQVTKAGPDYVLQVQLVDGDSGRLVTSAERKCEICGFAEMNQTLGEMVTAVGGRVDEAAVAGALEVTAQPEGARVRLDGKRVGTAPVALPAAPGTRTIEVSRFGYITREQPVSLVAGTTSHVDVRLQPSPRGAFRAAGFVALGGGIAALGAGATLLVLDGREAKTRCSGPEVDADGDCRFRYGTLPGGISATVGGGLLVGAAVALLVVGYRKEPERKVRAAWGPRGLALEGRF